MLHIFRRRARSGSMVLSALTAASIVLAALLPCMDDLPVRHSHLDGPLVPGVEHEKDEPDSEAHLHGCACLCHQIAAACGSAASVQGSHHVRDWPDTSLPAPDGCRAGIFRPPIAHLS